MRYIMSYNEARKNSNPSINGIKPLFYNNIYAEKYKKIIKIMRQILLSLIFFGCLLSASAQTTTELGRRYAPLVGSGSISVPTKSSVNDSFPQVSSVFMEINTTNYYKSPMIGIMLERGFVDEPTNMTYIGKIGAWFYPFKKENNFFIVQAGAYKTIKNFDIGLYLMDFNGHAFPRPSYNTQWDTMQKYKDKRPKDEYGYNSPFSAFFTARPFKDNKFEVTTKFSYFLNSNVIGTHFGAMVSLRYRLYGARKLIAPSPYGTPGMSSR